MIHPHLPISIVNFRDALGYAMELSDRHARAQVAVLLGRTGRPIDAAMTAPTSLVDDESSYAVDPVVIWASQRLPWPCSPHRVLLVSVGPMDPDLVREADLHRFRRSRWCLAEGGCQLLDWIETDGDLFRSYAYLTCPATAWPDDRPDHRAVDGLAS